MNAPAAPEQIQIEGVAHASDCALHNSPALPVGECDCGVRAKRETDSMTTQAQAPDHLAGGSN